MDYVSSAIMESFRIDPLANYNFQFENYFEDGNQFMEEVMREATSEPVKKSGVISKIWATIKKIFQWISRQWGRFVQWIKRLFSKKVKSADQCILETLGDKPGSGTTNEPKVVSNTHVASEPNDKSPVKSGTQQKVQIPFRYIDKDNGNSTSASTNSSEAAPSAPSVKEDTITLAFKDIGVKIENDQVIFYPNRLREDLARNQKGVGGKHVVANGETNSSWHAALTIYYFIDHPEVMAKLNEVIQMLQEKNWENGIFDATKFSAKVTELTKEYNIGKSVDNKFGLTITDVTKFNASLTELNKALDFYDDPTTIPGAGSPLVARALNDVAEIAWKLQFGMNMITGAMNSIHLIDGKYIESINNNEDLAKFIQKCIEGNVPPKYIAYNAFSVCSKEMRGSADQDMPAMGQSRLVLFPSNSDTITKIATSQYGVRANNAESMISSSLKKVGQDRIVAKVSQAYGNKCVISMEKADTNVRLDMRILMDIRARMDDACKKAGVTLNISDIHSANVGKLKDGRWAVIDYGFTER